MNRTDWQIAWPALRALGYLKTAECYGVSRAELAARCFLARETGPNGEFPFAPLAWRLDSWKARKHNAEALR